MRTPIMLLLFAALPLFGQTPCNPEKADCKVDEALNFYRGAVLVENAVVNTNKATTPPDAFAGRVHNSYQDFLNLFSFAINEVEESQNGQALVVRFNPLREGNHLFGLTLTIAKPSVADAVKNAIPEAARDATLKLLEKQLGDLDDRTLSGSYSWASVSCPPEAKGRCWGRQPKAYFDLLGLLLPPPGETTDIHALGDIGERLANLFPGKEGDVGELKVSEANDPEAALNTIKEIAAFEKASNEPAVKAFKERHFDLLAALIDNQPQVTGSATIRQRGRLGGAEERGATVEFHSGRENVNSLRATCVRAAGNAVGPCLQRRLNALADKGMSTDKFVATVTYKKASQYDLTDLRLDKAVEGFTAVKVPSATQYNVKVQGGRQLGAEVAGKSARADLSFEGIRTEDDGVRTKNRWVGTVTVSVPIGEKMTMPVSVTYANKAEFLGDQKERFGAHFGLSYRLPELFKKLP
jgi:hypothetical protein